MPDFEAGQASPQAWALDLHGMDVPVLVQIRRWASRTLDGLSDAHLGDVLLVATELVTNAYDHGDGPVQVRMTYTPVPCRVRIEVDDSNAARPVIKPASTRPRGRGMVIIDNLAQDWGVRGRPGTGTKTVWAEIACES